MQAQPESADEQSSVSKPPVVRNARACTVCRTAKMKCVGAEDGQNPCQRCKRTGAECIFEKHRRGRKPGSKLSEASKMLRRLEKGLNAAKLKQLNEASTSPVYPTADSRSPQGDPPFGGGLQSHDQYGSSGSRLSDGDDDDDGDRSDEKFPAKMIRKENSFFRTILNPEPKSPYHTTILPQASRSDHEHNQSRPCALPDGHNDPISAGLITEDKARILLDLIMLRLNPFINLFDTALHSLDYVRSRCPFLFTALMMAGCKFFEPDLYKDCLRLAHDLAVCAFSNAWKRVEVVQAFACMTYWREQEDNRTWMYIGYACRMAVELGLNRFVARPPPNETEFQLRERRNRERTYLVLFVHDRSLSMQTGRHWMLPEDDFIRHSDSWHTNSSSSTRCQDVVTVSFTQLRRIAAETTDMLHTNRSLIECGIDIALKNANAKLTQWSAKWEGELKKANGEPFHFSFISFFRLYTSLFLNSFGVQDHLAQTIRAGSHLRALSTCFDHALNVLHIASKDFRELSILQYGQETTCVMTAYSAIFLLRLLRNSYTELSEGAAHRIQDAISRTADAYNAAAQLSPTSSSASYHARFLWHLLRTRSGSQPTLQLDPVLQGPIVPTAQQTGSPTDDIRTMPQCYYPIPTAQDAFPREQPNAPTLALYNGVANRGGAAPPVPTMNVGDYTHADFNYYRNMLFELGFGENEQIVGASTDQFRTAPYGDAITAHYTQYPYPQTMAQNDFTSN